MIEKGAFPLSLQKFTLSFTWVVAVMAATIPCARPSFGAGSTFDSVLKETGEKDLAIALAHTSQHLVRANEGVSGGLFPQSWYQAIAKAYANTPVGDALLTESRYEDWQLVSLRVVPCEPLGLSPQLDPQIYCWPELRLVWQPVLRKQTRNGRYMEAAADDRAVHAIYPLSPQRFLTNDQAEKANRWLARIAASPSPQSGFAPLTASEVLEFSTLRDQLSARLIRAALALRSAEIPQREYKVLGIRPEFPYGKAEEIALRDRLLVLLRNFALPLDLKKLTSFSLPIGRDPVTMDEWIFLSFKGVAAQLQAEDITLHDLQDGRAIGPALGHQKASMMRDDEAFYEGTTEEADVFAAQVFLWAQDKPRLQALIQDRSRLFVPNTSCASCHKLNPLRFDFHNFSYLDDHEITIAPRVARDVELDLDWIRSRP